MTEGAGPGRRPRLLFVHAHPDDETISTGVSLAHHARLGHDVHVLTCTLGEEGEVIPRELAHLEGAPGDPLASHRRLELAGALAELGVTGHLLGVGGPAGTPRTVAGTAYRDSGMAGSPAAAHPRAFAAAEVEEGGRLVRSVVDAIRPDVVVSYDAHGGYLHPDHVQTHRVTVAALRGMSAPPPLYAVLTPRSWVDEDRAWLAEHVDPGLGYAVPGPDEPTGPARWTTDSSPTRRWTGRVVSVQQAALRRHATQVIVGDGWFALSNRVAARPRGPRGVRPRARGTWQPWTGRGVGRGWHSGAARPDRAGRPGLLEGVSV